MNSVRVNSSPNLLIPPASDRPEEYTFEGISANVKLLLKLIQDHNEKAYSRETDDRKANRVAGMMTILDDVKSRIEKSSNFVKKREAELRRCNTDLRPRGKERRSAEPVGEDDKLRRELDARRKSLEMMCSSLGKEKEIMAAELARKAGEIHGMEELIEDLRAQNESMMKKMAEQKEKRITGSSESHGSAALQERNRTLSEQLLKSIDGYRTMKRKFKDAHEENLGLRSTMEELRGEVERIRSKQPDADDRMIALEKMLERLEIKISKKNERVSANASKTKPPLVA